MKAKSKREKGNGFERLVARMVLDACNKGGFLLDRKECFRTPLSGGHPFADRGDLQIGPQLRKVFPFVVECKHQKIWNPGAMFRARENEANWLRQVKRATKETKIEGLVPLLVCQGNLTGTYCAAPWDDLRRALPATAGAMPRMLFRFEKRIWGLIFWEDFLTALTMFVADYTRAV
jgi:hypothetical protein